ncbi:MAG TPA: hypothetical protein VII31_05770, partial [Caldimonas sp.]
MAADENSNGAADPRHLWDEARRAVAGDVPQRGAAATSPVARYLDASRHGRELAALRRLPHAI